MAILYAMVARGSVVLAEFSAAATTASAVARQVLEKIPEGNDTHVSYSLDRHVFHVKHTDGITVLCAADEAAASESRSIDFLQLIPLLLCDSWIRVGID